MVKRSWRDYDVVLLGATLALLAFLVYSLGPTAMITFLYAGI